MQNGNTYLQSTMNSSLTNVLQSRVNNNSISNISSTNMSLQSSQMNTQIGSNGNDELNEKENNSTTTDDYVSRSTSRGEIADKSSNSLSVFKKVSLGRYYFVIPNKAVMF